MLRKNTVMAVDNCLNKKYVSNNKFIASNIIRLIKFYKTFQISVSYNLQKLHKLCKLSFLLNRFK